MGELWHAAKAWLREGCASRAAGVAFYTILSIAPFLVLALGLADLLVDAGAALQQLQAQLERFIGADGAALVVSIVTHAHDTESAGLAAVLALAATLIAATAAITELQQALDDVFGVQTQDDSIRGLLRVRLQGVALAMGAGILLVVSLVLSTTAGYLLTRSGLAEPRFAWVAIAVNELLSAMLVCVVFAALLRFLPGRPPDRNSALRGAIVAAVLVAVGRFAIGWYVSGAAAVKVYGAAGSVVVLMLWIYYIVCIFLFGALVARCHRHPLAGMIAPPRGPAHRTPVHTT
jgi:membrane protein